MSDASQITINQPLTPATAMLAELVRRYWVLGMECSLLEIQKLAWFLERAIERFAPDNPLNLQFKSRLFDERAIGIALQCLTARGQPRCHGLNAQVGLNLLNPIYASFGGGNPA